MAPEPSGDGADPRTTAVRAGRIAPPTNTPSSPPLFQASSYEFGDLDDVEEIYAGRRSGRIYGRYGGPNASAFEGAIAALERAPAAVGASSGMAAIDAALRTSIESGAAILVAAEIYGGTYHLLENDYRNSGFRVIYVDQADHAALEAAFAYHKPAVLYVEALTNPLMHVADIPVLAEISKRYAARLIVDATFASPALAQPFTHGADLVIHSVGKYIGGHGDVGAGVVSGAEAPVARIRDYLVRHGATIPHFEAWLALRGVRTLALRMAQHGANARAVATFLAREPLTVAVHHPSLSEHPEHLLAERLYPRGVGGMLAFDLAGGRDAVDGFLRGLTGIPIVHSLGEVATTVSYPAVSSHRPLAPDARAALGVGDGTVRLSVGIEAPDDILRDLAHAFAGLRARARA